MIVCPNCGTSNDDNAWKCVQCQTVLQQAPVATAPTQIPNYLWQSILCTVCCCIPLGIPAIVYAAQVNTKIAQGDIEGARHSSKNAGMWCLIALGGGILLSIGYGLMALLPALTHLH